MEKAEEKFGFVEELEYVCFLLGYVCVSLVFGIVIDCILL